jgi:hypothetical protein
MPSKYKKSYNEWSHIAEFVVTHNENVDSEYIGSLLAEVQETDPKRISVTNAAKDELLQHFKTAIDSTKFAKYGKDVKIKKVDTSSHFPGETGFNRMFPYSDAARPYRQLKRGKQ